MEATSKRLIHIPHHLKRMGKKAGKFLTKIYKLTKPKKPDFMEIEQSDNDHEIYSTPKSSISSNSDTDSSNSPTLICEICIDPMPLDRSFNLKGCTHFYCFNCIINYITSKLDDNVTSISCPVTNCTGSLDPDYCRPILPAGVFDRWGNALCEGGILGSQKFYCPFRDCSALLINDAGRGEAAVRQSVCPNCIRAFCAKCRVPWHSGYDCRRFQKLMKKGGDEIAMDFAKMKNWRRCPSCNYYVEKLSGCMYIKCWCGYAFCYNCGACSSTTSHKCPSCNL